MKFQNQRIRVRIHFTREICERGKENIYKMLQLMAIYIFVCFKNQIYIYGLSSNYNNFA